jgi:hypothetical protein
MLQIDFKRIRCLSSSPSTLGPFAFLPLGPRSLERSTARLHLGTQGKGMIVAWHRSTWIKGMLDHCWPRVTGPFRCLRQAPPCQPQVKIQTPSVPWRAVARKEIIELEMYLCATVSPPVDGW